MQINLEIWQNQLQWSSFACSPLEGTIPHIEFSIEIQSNNLTYQGNPYTERQQWHDNGQKEFEANWKNGEVVDGVVTFWDKEGDVTETETYKDGELVSSNNRLFENIFDKILDKIKL